MGHYGFLLNTSLTITCYFLCLRTHIHTHTRHCVIKINILFVTWRKGTVFWLVQKAGETTIFLKRINRRLRKWCIRTGSHRKCCELEMVNCQLTAYCPDAIVQIFFSWHVFMAVPWPRVQNCIASTRLHITRNQHQCHLPHISHADMQQKSAACHYADLHVLTFGSDLSHVSHDLFQ